MARKRPTKKVKVKMPTALSDMESQILEYVIEFTRLNCYQPSMKQIEERFNISPAAPSYHFRRMDDKGFVLVGPSDPRSKKILKWPDGRPFRGFALPPDENTP
jgi:hypothetical protein